MNPPEDLHDDQLGCWLAGQIMGMVDAFADYVPELSSYDVMHALAHVLAELLVKQDDAPVGSAAARGSDQQRILTFVREVGMMACKTRLLKAEHFRPTSGSVN